MFNQMMSFKTLHSALANVNSEQIVIAEDVSASGQKIFLRGSVSELDLQYADTANKHWYECLIDDKPSRIFLDVESLEHVDIDTIVDACKVAIGHKFGVQADMKILDSCSDKKYSWHVLCCNLYLKNVYHVGAFVRRLILSLTGHPYRHAIDAAVYTKNRMFRVAGSSKFGSSRILKHTGKWYDLLVQSPTNSTQNTVECLEIDGSTPHSTSMHPDKMFVFENEGWRRLRYVNRRQSNAPGTCNMLHPILDWLDRNRTAQTCRHNTSFTSSGHFFVSTRSKKCAIAKRTHKGNNIWFDIDTNRQIVFQRCYDQDCSGHCVPVQVPSEQWSLWNTTWHQLIHAPRNENTLFNMSQ